MYEIQTRSAKPLSPHLHHCTELLPEKVGRGWGGGVLQFSESLVFLTFVFQEKSKILREIFLVKEIICYTMGMLLNFAFL